MGCFWPQYIMFYLKKHRGVTFHNTREWCKILKKTNLWFGKWHEEFEKFSPKQTKVSKLGLLLGPFVWSWKCMSLEFPGELCVITMKRNWLLVRNLHGEFNKFLLERSNISQICTLMGCFWPKYIMSEIRKYRALMFDGTQYWYKVWRKTDLCFQKWHEEFSKFSPEHLKVSKLGLWWHLFV